MPGSRNQKKRDAETMREILVGLRSGKTFGEICSEIGIAPDGRLKHLRKKYPSFNAEVEEIRWGHGKAVDRAEGSRNPWENIHEDVDSPKIKAFLEKYRETRSRSASALAVGFRPSTVMEMLDPTNKKFDAEFARAMREEEYLEGWEIEDDYKMKARMGDPVNQRHFLERRIPEYGQKAKSATESNDAKFHPEAMKAAMGALKEILLEISRTSVSEHGRPADDAEPGEPAEDGRGLGEVAGLVADPPN